MAPPRSLRYNGTAMGCARPLIDTEMERLLVSCPVMLRGALRRRTGVATTKCTVPGPGDDVIPKPFSVILQYVSAPELSVQR